MIRIHQLAVVFFATIFLKFTAPVVSLVYKTNDAVIIEDDTIEQPQNIVTRLPIIFGNYYGNNPLIPFANPYYLGHHFDRQNQPSYWYLTYYYPYNVMVPFIKQQESIEESTSAIEFKQAQIRCGAGPEKSIPRVVGGAETGINAWPAMVAIRQDSAYLCGGTLIARNKILTAARCVNKITSSTIRKLSVDLGMHVIYSGGDAQLMRGVRRVAIHRDYAQTNENDIAVLTLSRPIRFNQTISPACLPSADLTFEGKDATVVGWGATASGGALSKTLQQVDLNILADSKCNETYATLEKPVSIIDSMLCAAADGKDTCDGDTGSPLFLRTDPSAPWTQIGITSFGDKNCVFTRVSSFVSWIQRQ